MKLPKHSTIASFVHFVVATVIIINLDIPCIPWWIEGGIVGLAMMTPMLIHVGQSDKKPIPIIAFNAVLFGTIAGAIGHYWI